MQNRTRTLLRLALAGTSLLTLATMASAQDQATATDGTTVLEDVVVNGGSGGVITADGYVGKSSATGAKTDTPFLQTPQSISSVTQQQLEDRNPQTLLDTVAYTPGVRVGGYGFDPRFDSFTLRGVERREERHAPGRRPRARGREVRRRGAQNSRLPPAGRGLIA